MADSIPQEAQSPRFTAYYGTTLENFLTCAKVTDSGVVFVKRQEQQHVEPEATQLIYGLTGGASYAFVRAKELGHTPLIVEGELDRSTYYLRQELFPGEPFPVTQVWVPKEGVDWRSYNRFTHDPEEKETYRVFEAKKPLDIITHQLRGESLPIQSRAERTEGQSTTLSPHQEIIPEQGKTGKEHGKPSGGEIQSHQQYSDFTALERFVKDNYNGPEQREGVHRAKLPETKGERGPRM